eukprot:3671453-Pyramimonas_sp.AAC.1
MNNRSTAARMLQRLDGVGKDSHAFLYSTSTSCHWSGPMGPRRSAMAHAAELRASRQHVSI